MLKYLVCFILGISIPILAQNTVVSGTLVDPAGNTWSAATITAVFTEAPGVPGPYNWDGGTLNKLPATVTSSSGGAFSITLPTNVGHIFPSGSTWLFSICPNASLQCAVVNVALSGSTFDLVPTINGANAWPTGYVIPTVISKVYNTNQTATPPQAQGGMVYNTTNQTMNIYTSTGWQPFAFVGGNPVITNPSGNQTVTQPNGTTLGVNSLNNILNAALFPGADIGAKVNAAYAALGTYGGKIIIPSASSCYSYTTPIVFNTTSKLVILQGEGGACIQYTSTSGVAITFDANGTLPHISSQGIRDLIIMGPGGEFVPISGTAQALQIGITNGAEGFTFSNSKVSGFSLGATFGDNTFNTLFDHDVFINNTVNINYPDTLFNSGEHIVFEDTSFSNSTTTNVAGCVTIHGTTGLSMVFSNVNFDSCQLNLVASGAQQAHISLSNPYFEDPAGHSAAPMLLNNGGAYLTIDSPTFYSNSTFPTFPITVSGQGGTYVHGIRIFGTGATAVVGVDSSHKTFIYGSVFDSENPTLPSYAYTGTPSGSVTLIGDQNQVNQIYTNADPGFVIRSGGSGGSDSVAAFSGPYLWSGLWSGVGQSYYPNGIVSLGPQELGFCYGDAGALPVANINCDNKLNSGVMDVTQGYDINGKQALFTAIKTISADGTYILATSTSTSQNLSGVFLIDWEPGVSTVDRRQEIVATVYASNFDTTYTMTVSANNAYKGNVVFSNLRVVKDASGNMQLAVDVANRNTTGTDTLRVTRLGDISYTPTLFPVVALGSTSLIQYGSIQNPDGSITINSLKSITGTRFLCTDTTGKIISSPTACSGT